MNVVALLSGGKDSCYTVLKVRSHGHTVVALAHITPPCDEPDSFMYQSVGSSAVPSLASAMGLPLVTSPTHARAKNTHLAYSRTDGDEVEDLVALLRVVKRRFPAVNAVCAGALWSDYQRLRVEDAASRAGLLSLAPLWRREQRDLLDEMLAAGVHAVLVKVAGVGLNASHLGKSLAQMRPTLHALEARYGSHVCGEGGEYETLVLWMPGLSHRLVLDDVDTVVHSHDPVAPVAFLRVNALHLAEPSAEQCAWPRAPPPPELPPPFRFDPVALDDEDQPARDDAPGDDAPGDDADCATDVSVGEHKDFLHVTSRSAKPGGDGVREACELLERALQRHACTLADVVTVHLHLSAVSGERYAAANKGYTQVFGRADCVPPPGRACVGIGASPANAPTSVETLVRRRRTARPPTLHVQSLSEWAPPCIGPYAQFVEEDGVLHLSGALPLYAPDAAVPAGMPAGQQVAAVAHNMRRTLEASRSSVEKLGLFVVYVVGARSERAVTAALERELVHARSVCAIVPVDGLPKGAAVEVRAVGVLSDADLQVPGAGPATSDRLEALGIISAAVACGALGYVVLSSQRAVQGAADVCGAVRAGLDAGPFTAGGQPLALQVYVRGGTSTSTCRGSLQGVFPRCGISVFRVPWLAHGAEWMAIATFVLR